MSDYIMEPGARLEIGPGGKPYEQLGACCAGCANGAKSCGSLGATESSNVPFYLAAAGIAALGLFLFMSPLAPPRRRRRNPSTFTRKGERMYRHIRAGYGYDPRAKEIAARTVYTAAKHGTRGLVRRRR